jgi:hypothetical protein
VTLVSGDRASWRRQEGPGPRFTSAIGRVAGHPGARPVANSAAQSPAGSSSDGASLPIHAAQVSCEVVG